MKKLFSIISFLLIQFSLVSQATVTQTVRIPTQTGNAGKVLGTNGTSLSWTTAAGGSTVGLAPSNSPTLTGVTTQSNTIYNGSINEFKGADITSSATVAIGASTGNYVHITGTVTINNFDVAQAGTLRTTVFDNTLTVTTSTNIILPNSLSIATSTNDVAIWRSEGSGVWRLVSYQLSNNSSISYSPTWTGFSSPPSGGVNEYILSGKLCYVNINPTVNGTTNATTCTVTLPFNAKHNSSGAGGWCTDSTTKTVFWSTTAGSNVLSLSPTVAGTAWANSGGVKKAILTLTYEIQ